MRTGDTKKYILPLLKQQIQENHVKDMRLQNLQEEKETVHIYYEYEDIIKSIMDATDANMNIIPLNKWLARFRPFGFTDDFTEEQKVLVERLTNSIIRFAGMFHYTIKDDTNGYYLKDNQFNKVKQ